MKIQIVSDDGELLDDTDISADEWLLEVERNPHGILASLSPGAEALGQEPEPPREGLRRKPKRDVSA